MTESLKRVAFLSLAALLSSLVVGCNPPSAASSGRAAIVPSEAEDKGRDDSPDFGAKPEPTSPAGSIAEAGELPRPPTEATAEPATSPKINRPPRADRQPAKPGDAEKITFDDLNLQMLPNIVYRPFMVNDRVRELEGQRVSISGYMHGGAAGSSGIKKFVLLKNTECKFGKDGQADHLAIVYLKSGAAADFTSSDVKVEGTLRVDPFTGADGNTWSIYNLEDAQIR